MTGYCILYLGRRNDATSLVKPHREHSLSSRILDYVCNSISMLKINYTIALNGISVNQPEVTDIVSQFYEFHFSKAGNVKGTIFQFKLVDLS